MLLLSRFRARAFFYLKAQAVFVIQHRSVIARLQKNFNLLTPVIIMLRSAMPLIIR